MPLRALWTSAGLPADALAQLTLTGAEPVLPSSFAVGAAAQASFAAAALAATEIGQLRNGLRQQVRVDMRHAALECSGRFLLDGVAPNVWDKLAGLYACGDRLGAPAHQLRPPPRRRAAPARPARRSRHDRRDAGRGRAGALARCRLREAAQPSAAWSSPRCALSTSGTRTRRAPRSPRSHWSRSSASASAAARLPALAATAPAARRHARARPDAHPRRAGGRPHARRLRRRRDARQLAAAAEHRGDRRHQPRQASAHADLRNRGRSRRAGAACCARRTSSLQGYRPGSLAALGFGARGVARGSAPASSTSRSRPTAEAAPGRRGAASTRWCRPPPASTHAEGEAAGDGKPQALADADARHGHRRSCSPSARGRAAAPAARRRQLACAGLAGADRRSGCARSAASPTASASRQARLRDRGWKRATRASGRLLAIRHAARFSATPARYRRPSVPPGHRSPRLGLTSLQARVTESPRPPDAPASLSAHRP